LSPTNWFPVRAKDFILKSCRDMISGLNQQISCWSLLDAGAPHLVLLEAAQTISESPPFHTLSTREFVPKLLS